MNSIFSGRDFNEWRFVFQAPWGRLGLFLALAAAVATITLGILSTREERKVWRRVLLGVLRTGAVGAALILFLQPAIQLENVTRLPNRVAVVVDRSASMALAEKPGAATRSARAASLISRAGPAFEEWRKLHHVDFYSFGGPGAEEDLPAAATAQPKAQANPSGVEPSTEEALRKDPQPEVRGEATRMREALQSIRGRYEGRDLGGVVLISDGIDNGRFAGELGAPAELDAEAKDFLHSIDAPVHTIWTGTPGIRDVAIARVLADDFAFARNVVKVEAVVRILGGEAWRRKRLPITLRRDGQVVRTVEVTVDPDRPDQKVSFEFTPDRVGKYLYEVSTPVLDGDAIPENNSRQFLLKVIRDKIRALLVAGRPSWDERFLRGLLKHNPNVDLISFFILRTPTDVELVPPDEMSLIPFPTEELFLQQLRSFDVVFLQNFNYGPYGIGAYLGEIRDYVMEGGGLAMIGGDLSFTSGGYAHSAVADVLPVELPEPGPEDRLLNYQSFKMKLTGDGRGHPVTALKLEGQKNALRWDALPPLDGANLVSRAKPNATVLGVHPSLKGDDGKPLPILVASDMGKGRSLAFMSDSSWRWGFGNAGTVEEGDSRGHDYQRFWENSIRWLVRDPELRLLRVESDQGAYRRGERVRIRVRAFDTEYRPAKRLEVALSVARVGAGAPQPVAQKTVRTDDNGEAEWDLGPLPPSGYRAIGRAGGAGSERGSAMAAANQDDEVFLVRGAGRELEDPEARDGVLKAIAEGSGGSYLGEDPSEATLRDLAFQKPEVVRVNKHRDLELWSTWVTLLVAAVFLSMEWTIRRRNGLL